MNTALKVAGTIFLVVSMLHFLRLVFKVRVTIGSFTVPSWISVLAVIVPLLLSLWMFKSIK